MYNQNSKKRGEFAPTVNEKRIDLKSVLKTLKIEKITKNRTGFLACCPSKDHDDKNPSWSIYDTNDNRFGRHRCMSCGYQGTFFTLIADLLEITEKEDILQWLEDSDFYETELQLSKSFDLVPWDKKMSFLEGVVFRSMHEWDAWPLSYLKQRKIEPYQVIRHKIGYAFTGPLKGRIVFPKVDKKGQLQGYSARSFLKVEDRKYLEATTRQFSNKSILFGESFWDNKFKQVIVTEGIFNALSLEQAYLELHADFPNLMALTGSTIHASVFYKLSNFEKVVIATDNDLAGNKAANELFLGLNRYVPFIERVEFDQGSDANELSQEALIRAFRRRIRILS